ncbi:thioredoxin family protein [Niabella beijingensis]|uniref:thioredoxin family protein n=1 Tax=Niabella beijingensis TaxID=2872700 RepID=UPI001CBAAAE3|nr:thioredoxin family protein [Niabella beijingensis]MBZ4192546.1 thioredoxin family protein [Niabella beijingensis]
MKTTILLLTLFLAALANAQIRPLAPGSIAPDIRLTNTNEKVVGFDDFPKAKGFIVVFTCNTCPYAKAYEQRIISLNEEFSPRGYPVIAVNPNDPAISKGDSFENMKERAKEKGYTFPYLFDPGQKVTNLYGAAKTPHLFLIRKNKSTLVIEYTGAIDDDPQQSNAAHTNYVREAINALDAGKQPAITATKAIGCGVARPKNNNN